jgi:hypothetical protein
MPDNVRPRRKVSLADVPIERGVGGETHQLADEGFVRLDKGRSSAQDFLRRCGELRYWERTGTS